MATTGAVMAATAFVAPGINLALADNGQYRENQPTQLPGFWTSDRANAPAPVRAPAPAALDSVIQSLGRNFNGQVGIAVQSIDDGWTINYNGNRRYPQQSVSKLWVAMTMLDAVDRGKITLATPVTIRPQDLTLFHQPIAAMVKPEGYTTTVQDLFYRAMTQSDNTANDSVMRAVGGPSAVQGFLARRFIDGVRFGPGERLLQSGTAGLIWDQNLAYGRSFYAARAALPLAARNRALDAYLADPPDGASPVGIVTALAKLKRGEMLSPASTSILLSTMSEAKTGPQRIKGGVPAGWYYAHKTGTGQELAPRSTGFNDVGIMTAPDGSSYALAVMIGSTTVSIPERWALMQAVSRTVAGMHQPAARSAYNDNITGRNRP
ncbi:class A beta-lactamase-related serine hydrolase [Sphingobium sufflavum]|uniref:serine hydrolase n=1 Tax=Sphingobium sufflavum TaxID=1129547 RepID=UPI001F43D431|nr:serine hydrolase [Sphingobium sufflavum]MCE7795603.1 class A beta-lactamase-related serine hydrolase [Sphingobium sufflavum]